LTDVNIDILLEMAAGAEPNRQAVSTETDTVTYAELQLGAQRLGSTLAQLSGGRAITYIGTASMDFPRLLFAAACAGVPLIPLNYRVKEDEYQRLLEVAQPGLVVVQDRYREIAERAAARVSTGLAVLHPRDLKAGDAVDAPMDPDSPAVRLFTSGTTKAPKLVNLSHDNLVGYVLETVPAASAEAGEAALLAAPPYHIAGIANVLTSIYRCRRVHLMAQFEPKAWLEIVREQRISHAMVVPTMLARILDVLEQQPDLAPETLVNLAYGGSRAPLGLVERALRMLPETVGLVNAFGLTETSSTVAMLSPRDHVAAWRSSDPGVRRRLGSVGRTVPGIEARIVRDDGMAAGPDEHGEIRLRGGQISTGYAVGGRTVDDDNWLHTGDLGYLDGDGYLFITGRRDDLIIRGGENINPTEIEDVLRLHDGVSDALVVGVPDPEWGEQIAAVVCGRQDDTAADDLRQWVRDRLAGFKVPTVIKWVDDLPRNDMGKPVRARARAMLA
jgi:acyl-CoA synthetase (AMP-forming)/AMP-acid ligase II